MDWRSIRKTYTRHDKSYWNYEYFYKIICYNRNYGAYCVRCGCRVGSKQEEKTLYNCGGIWVCGYCYDQKNRGARNTPDFEDLTENQYYVVKDESERIMSNIKQ